MKIRTQSLGKWLYITTSETGSQVKMLRSWIECNWLTGNSCACSLPGLVVAGAGVAAALAVWQLLLLPWRGWTECFHR